MRKSKKSCTFALAIESYQAMKKFFLAFLTLAALALNAEETPAFLTRVGSEEDLLSSRQYVFCRNNRVLLESAVAPLPTTDVWRTDSLYGTEGYVWTLTRTIQGYLIGGQYSLFLILKNNNAVCDPAATTSWTFTFAEDSTATIVSGSRFLGETSAFSGQYKAYSNSSSYLAAYPHDFTIYRLDYPKPEDPEPTSLVRSPLSVSVCKKIVNGQLVITRDNRSYTILGRPL